MKKFIKICEKPIEIKEARRKVQAVCVYPTYLSSGKDIMKKGGKFYAILNHETSMWSTKLEMSSEVISSVSLK